MFTRILLVAFIGLMPGCLFAQMAKVGDLVRLELSDRQSMVGEVMAVKGDSLTCLDLETFEISEQTVSDSSKIRTGVTGEQILDRVGIGPWFAWKISKKFERASAPQLVASIQQSLVFITTNPENGLQKDDEVDVFRPGTPVVHPQTGEVLDRPEVKIARMKVKEISEKLVTCQIVGELTTQLEVGDVVRPSTPRNNVAVLPFTDATGRAIHSGLAVSNEIIESLNRLGIATLERKRLADVLNEKMLGASGLTNGSEIASVGQLLGASTLVLGMISADASNPKRTIYSVRLVDVRTGSVIETLESDVSTKDVDFRVVERMDEFRELQSSETPDGAEIQPFSSGSRTISFFVPNDATKVEMSFSHKLRASGGGNTVDKGLPGRNGNVIVNSKQALVWLGETERRVNGRIVSNRDWRLHDGTILNNLVARNSPNPTIIDITPLIKRDAINELTFVHRQGTPSLGLKISISR